MKRPQGRLPALLPLSCILAAAAATAQDWPMWGANPGRTGILPDRFDREPVLEWVLEMPPPQPAWPTQFDDGSKLDFDLAYSPVSCGDSLFVASMVSDSLTAFKLDSGIELWRFHTDGPVRLAPAVWSNRLYSVSDDGNLYCLDTGTGALLWKYRAASGNTRVLGNNRVISAWPARGGPVILDGKVYFAAGVWPFMGTSIHALDAEDGSLAWASTGDACNWQPQPHAGAVSFAGLSPQGYLAASGNRLLVSGGRTPPGLFNRNTGETVLVNLFSPKGSGGYDVAADEKYFYHSNARFNIGNGSPVDGPATARDPALAVLATNLVSSHLMPGDGIFTAITARSRVIVSTLQGRIYCFGPGKGKPAFHSMRGNTPPETANSSRMTADFIMKHCGTKEGFALFLGIGNGELAGQIVMSSGIHVTAIEPNADTVARLRTRLDNAGLYGKRIAILHDDPAQGEYPPYISSVIIVQDPMAAGIRPDRPSLERICTLLRPYGGKAFIAFTSHNAQKALKELFFPGVSCEFSGGFLIMTREGPLPGAGQWTHQYADTANTGLSEDILVRLPLGLLWFGSTGHDNTLPRHASGPRPQVSGGRLVMPGVETLSARDVYTGRELWSRKFPGLGHHFTDMALENEWLTGKPVYMRYLAGATYIGSPFVTLPDSVYVRYRRKIYRLEPDTGEAISVFNLPSGSGDTSLDWGHISVSGDMLVTTALPHIFDSSRFGEPNWNAASSEKLIVMNRFTGRIIWQREADIGFRHNAIASHDGRLFVIDGLSQAAMNLLARRGKQQERPSSLMEIELATGRIVWQTKDSVSGTFLSFSHKHNILLEGGTHSLKGGRLQDEPQTLTARSASDGTRLWGPVNGGTGPRIILDNLVIPAQPGPAIDITTGREALNQHPLTGEPVAWSYWKSYGCGPANASRNMLLFRSGSAGFHDLAGNSGTGNFGGFKSGCTANLMAADGILSAPDYTRTCTCSYQNQTSLGLIHMPDADIWTYLPAGRGTGSITRIGINIGAPGNRRDGNGILWVPYPAGPVSTPYSTIASTTHDHPGMHPEAKYPVSSNGIFRLHSLSVEGSSDAPAWIAASGMHYIRRITLEDLKGNGKEYTVRLHFCEPDGTIPGQRLFNITINGHQLIKNFDIVATAGTPRKAVVCELKSIPINDSLDLTFEKARDSRLLPLICGIEIKAGQ